jgi:hypothetical protein
MLQRALSARDSSAQTARNFMRPVIAVFRIPCLVSASFAQDIGWPREKSNANGTIIYYQPQLDDWKNFRQPDARKAVSVRAKAGQPTVGVVYLRARSDANLDTHNVVLSPGSRCESPPTRD